MNTRSRWLVIAIVLLMMSAGVWKWMHRFPAMPSTLIPPPPPAEVVVPPAIPPSTPVVRPAPRPVAPRRPAKVAIAHPRAPVAPPHVVSPPTPPVAPAPVPVPMLPAEPATPRRWKGNDTAIRRSGEIVVKNDRQWIQFWSEHRPHEPAPEVDFTKDMVVGVFAGTRPADPFAVEIVGTRGVGQELIVDFRERTPPTGTVAINVSVYPYDIQAVPRSSMKVKFNKLDPLEAGR